MSEFYMSFSANGTVRTGNKESRKWYMNQGNIGDPSGLTWNPMPYAAKLVKIQAVLSPSYSYGQAKISVTKNAKIQKDISVFIPAKKSSASADVELDFKLNDYIGLAVELEDVTTDVWPSAVLTFVRV